MGFDPGLWLGVVRVSGWLCAASDVCFAVAGSLCEAPGGIDHHSALTGGLSDGGAAMTGLVEAVSTVGRIS